MTPTKRMKKLSALIVASLAAGAAVIVGPLTPGSATVAAPTPAECQIFLDDLNEAGLIIDAADRAPGNLTAEQIRTGQIRRELALIAWSTCLTPATTTTTAGPTTTSTTAPTTTTTTAPSTTTTTTGTQPPPGIFVNEAAIPAPRPGISGPLVVNAQDGVGVADGGVAAFRTSCRLSHMNFDDPLLYPGQSRRSHLHSYFGNTAVSAGTNLNNLATTGNSTCSGGTLNRTGYWVPSMIDTTTGNPITTFTHLDANWQWSPNIDGHHALQVYYKSGYQGVEPQEVVAFPTGLRIFAGDASRTTASQPGSIVGYRCTFPADQSGAIGSPSIPACSPGNMIVMVVRFPQCWNGVDLDSPNHKSHMAYSIPGSGCPASHPVALPEITYNIRYWVTAGQNTLNWRLSSDTYSGPAGYSGHADWVNGWDPATEATWLDRCYTPSVDCHLNLLGDGRELTLQ